MATIRKAPATTPAGKRRDDDDKPRRYVVANVEVRVLAERVQYFDANGRLITESLKDYTRKTIGKEFASFSDFLKRWNGAEKKQAVIDELAEQGVFFDALAEEVGQQGKAFDPFDLLCHVAWGQPPLTRRERAENVKSGITSASTANRLGAYWRPCWINTPMKASARLKNRKSSALPRSISSVHQSS